VRRPGSRRRHGLPDFTLVPALTATENLVVSRADAPAVIDWRRNRKALETFLDAMPFRVALDKPVSAMAAGEKQKLEILRLLYLNQRCLILDEPTSVLTPGEADEILGLLRDMADLGDITVASRPANPSATSPCSQPTIWGSGSTPAGESAWRAAGSRELRRPIGLSCGAFA
jgi:simple sugar transport system ATP-binding protein